MNPFQRTFS